MVSRMYYRPLEFVVIGSDSKRADQLKIDLGSTVHHFPTVSSFIGFLTSTPNASEYLILLISNKLFNNLPPNIKQRVRELYIYTDDPGDKTYQTFKDACLILRGLVIVQYNAEFVSSHMSNDLGLAKANLMQIMQLNKSQIQDLQDLYDELDENEQCGQEATDCQ